MSRSKRKKPISGITTSGSEVWDKAKWHRRHRREERERLKVDPLGYVWRSHKEHSSLWNMFKDGKFYWGKEVSPKTMRK